MRNGEDRKRSIRLSKYEKYLYKVLRSEHVKSLRYHGGHFWSIGKIFRSISEVQEEAV